MSTPEHPFAQYIRILGKGPHLSRHLTEDEALAAARMVMADEIEPVQLGAFLCLMRVRSETPEELAGLVRAARETFAMPADAPKVDLDWPSYAGKKNRQPWFLLSAVLLAGSGTRIFMHGAGEHTAGRVYTEPVLRALGFGPARSLDEAAAHIAARNFAFLPLTGLSPRLAWLMSLKPVIGLRSPIHTAVKALNPFDAPCQVIGVAHPPYRALHQETARVLGQKRLAVFKGDGGEAERRPEKQCDVALSIDGETSDETWSPLLPTSNLPHDETIEPARLRDVWRGEDTDATGEALVTGTAAILLKLLGRARTQQEAQTLAETLWAGRDRARLDGAA
jgi:anthranilate phosphoribosyltransferase